MNIPILDNVNIKSIQTIATPSELRAEIPLTPAAAQTVEAGRRTIERILDGDDPRFLAIVGPCSIHNLDAGDHVVRAECSNRKSAEALVTVKGEETVEVTLDASGKKKKK